MIKMLENIEKQRKILSANNEHNLTIECLVGEEDFDYTMKREELENIMMPVLSEYAPCLYSFKDFI